jgi:hypothetical protein
MSSASPAILLPDAYAVCLAHGRSDPGPSPPSPTRAAPAYVMSFKRGVVTRSRNDLLLLEDNALVAQHLRLDARRGVALDAYPSAPSVRLPLAHADLT